MIYHVSHSQQTHALACMKKPRVSSRLTVPLPSTLFGRILVRFRLNPAISIFLKRTVNLTCGMLNQTVHDLKTIKIFFSLKSIYMHFIRSHKFTVKVVMTVKTLFQFIVDDLFSW